ncbi:MAG: GNAT family N-acetyltransferase, partial [Candidatus Limnocylindrales bacterium]
MKPQRAAIDTTVAQPASIADCERLQASWFVAGAAVNGGEVWHDGPLTWTWHPYNRHVMLLFPTVIPVDDLARGLQRVAALNPRIVGAWLGVDVDPANLADVGFERGWAPWWMTASIKGLGPPSDDRVALETMTPEYIDPDDQALLALARTEPHQTWHAAARVDGRLAGHAWGHLDGDVAGIFQMAVWPQFRRRGLV